MKTHVTHKFRQLILPAALLIGTSFSGTIIATGQDASPPLASEETAEAPQSPAPTDPDAVKPEPEARGSTIDGERMIREKMQIFRAYEGEWEGVQSYAPAEGSAAFESKSGWTGSYQLNGMYFEMDGFSEFESGRSSYRWMITYDVVLEKYRAWTFNSNGIVTDWVAHYDAEQKQITWRFVDPRTGIRGWLRTQSLQPNVVTGHGIAKTEGALVISDYRLNFKRKKLRI